MGSGGLTRANSLNSFTKFGTLPVFEHLGSNALGDGRWEQAREAFRSAVSALEQVRINTVLIRDRQEWMEKNIRLFKGLVESCLRLGRYEEAVEYVESGRSRVLLDMLYVRDFEPRNCPREKVEEYRQKREQAALLEAMMAAEGRAGPSGGSQLAARAQEKTTLLDNLRRLEDEMRELDPDYFALAKPSTLPEMRAVAAALERTLVIIWTGSRQAAIFFIMPDGGFEHMPLPELGDAVVVEWMFGPLDDPKRSGWLGAYIEYLREKSSHEEQDASRQAWMDQIERTLATLYERLMQRIHVRLKERRQTSATFIVGGLLGLLPLHGASWNSAGETHYLIEDIDVAYAPSVWVLQRCWERKRDAEVPVLTVATSGDDAPLAFTDWEVKQISKLIHITKGATACSPPLVGEKATTAAVLGALPHHAIGHLSCHGEWHFGDPLASALLLADRELTLGQLLAEVRLDKARLLVLSACESGTGYNPNKPGEEYLGLPAGFIFAGARSVVGSL
jgi:hypothetical protein